MKQLIALINPAIPFGKALNALGHTSIGIGHWIPLERMPSIKIFFAEEKTIRAFRRASRKITAAFPDQARCADFTHTMTIGPSDNCLKITSETPESQLVYFAASLCAEESQLTPEILTICGNLKEAASCESDRGSFEFRPLEELPDYRSIPTKRISLILDRTANLVELLHATVQGSLEIGAQCELNDLKLLAYCDGDGEMHSCISYHPFPILSARPQSKLQELASRIESDPKIRKSAMRNRDGNTLAVCLFGEEEAVNVHSRQKFISLWTAEPVEKALLV